MKVFTLNIDDLSFSTFFPRGLEFLPDAARKEIGSYSRENDRYRVLGGKLLLEHALRMENTGRTLAEVCQTDKGRLFLPGSSFDFNISHSGSYVVLACTFEGRCGIDIEMHREVDPAIFRRLFTDGEWEAIQGSEDPLKVFFKCWAIKESVIKADGRGVEVLSRTEILSEDMAACDGRTWYFKMLDIAPHYSSAIAAGHPVGPVEPISMVCVSMEDLERLIAPHS